MKPERWSQVRSLFERAAAVPPADRHRFLDESTADDRQLRAEVERLLEAITDNPAFLEPPDAARVVRSFERETADLEPGVKLGTYRIVRRLGAGGMGAVYEAVQERPERTVALKVLRDPLAGSDARRRFLVEAELLGRLRHPGIATVHEMGEETLPGGREVPFFALELVPGARDIVSYASEAQLPLRATLELFRQVCAAVHHAHLSGVLHRDLKPDNLLVDESGRAKVIDYGVARAMDPALTPAGLESLGAEMVGTLQYMSPEQLSGGSAAADARADVYALGLVLYELVGGARPYRLSSKPLAEVVQTVCEDPVAPPSAHASGLSRELDWIVLRALAKEPDQRYESAAELSRDLGRFLSGEPVLAAPPSALYRARKFVSRNRLAVGAAGLVFASLAGGVVSTGRALGEARDEGARASRAVAGLELETREKQRALDALKRTNIDLELASARAQRELDRQVAVTEAFEDLLLAVGPEEDGYQVTLFSLLERGRPRFDDPEGDPLQRALLASFFGNAYWVLGLGETAEVLYTDALGAIAGAQETAPLLEANIKIRLANVLTDQLRLEEALGLLEEAEAAASTSQSTPALMGLQIAVVRSIVAEHAGDLEGAEAALQEGLATFGPDLSPSEGGLLRARSRHGLILIRMERVRDARDLLEEVWSEARDALGDEHPVCLEVGNRLSQALHASGQTAEALELQKQVADATGRLHGERSQAHATALSSLVSAYLGVRDLDGALAAGERGLDVLDLGNFEALDLEIALRTNYSIALGASGRHAEAVTELEQVVEILEDSGQFASLRMYEVQHNLGEALLLSGDLESAAEAFETMHYLAGELFGSDGWQVHLAASRLGLRALLAGETDEGLELLRSSHAGMQASGSEVGGQYLRQIERSLSEVVRMLRDEGQVESADRLSRLLEGWGLRPR